MSTCRRTSFRALLSSLLLLGLVGVVPAFAQGTAAISGRVTDPQGLALPGVTVTLTNPATSESRTVTTNEVGLYQITMTPGTYELSMTLDGFQTVRYESVTLAVGSTHRQDVQMAIGALSEVIVVQGADVAALNTVDASVGNAMTERQIKSLPVEALSVVGLLSLQPGVVFIPTTSSTDSDPRYGASAGARADQQTVTLDGIDVNDPQLQAAFTSAVRVTQEALQEFRVATSNYNADMGRSSGPQVSMVTRSGTNRFSGSGYWFLRRTATSTNEYFLQLTQQLAGNPEEVPLLDKDIGGVSLGGPIRRDKFFFFANYEGLQEESDDVAIRGVPSDSFRDGVLMYECANPALCPATNVMGFSNSHAIPAGWYGLTPAEVAAIDPLGIGPSMAASQYFKQYPSPNEPGLDGHNIMDYRFKAPITNDFKTFIGRADFKPDSNNSVFFRYNMQDDVINSLPSFPGEPPSTQTVFKNKGLAIGWDRVMGSNMMNSFRYGWTQIDTGTIGQRDSNFVTFRFISSYNSTSTTSTRKTPTHNIVNDFSWLKGEHAVKVGTNLRFTRIPSTDNSNSFLSVSINPSWIQGQGRKFQPGGVDCTTPGCFTVPAVAGTFNSGYADAWLNILGVLSQSNLNANYDRDGNPLPVGEALSRKYASDEYEFYVQDTWQLAPNFTLTFGLRYSLHSPPYEVNGLQVAPTPSMGDWFEERRQNALAGIPSNASPLVTFDLAGPKNGGRGFYEWDKNNVAPRVAFAWTPEGGGWLTGDGRMVVRGGYAKVFDRIGQGIALNFDSGASFGMSTSLPSAYGLDYETIPEQRFVDINLSVLPPTMPVAPPGGFPQTPPVEAGVITSTIDSNIVTPSAHMVNLFVGRELPGNLSLEVGYLGRFGRDLLLRRDMAMPLNLVDPASGMDYFTAAQTIIKATEAAGIPGGAAIDAYTGLAPIPYWENLFPDAAFGGLTATQQVARRFNRDSPDFITSLWLMDQFCIPACSKFGPYSYFSEQYDSVAAVSSIGRSNYNALNITIRKRYSDGFQMDFNYTLSHSEDHGSQVERGGAFGNFSNGGYTGFLVNTWDKETNWGDSDFDVRHQFNTNWIWDLPFGQGRAVGGNVGGAMNHVIGNWSFAGLMRWTSGFPFNVYNCRSCWATNWNLQGNAELVDPNNLPPLGTTLDAVEGRPSPFKDPEGALDYFRRQLPGETGIRNVLRGDGYFTIDTSISKAWQLPFGDSRLRFRWDIFNLTNTAKFDVDFINAFPDRSGFGRYDRTLATCDALAGRCMQFALRFEF